MQTFPSSNTLCRHQNKTHPLDRIYSNHRFVRDRISVRGDLHPLALVGIVVSLGAPRNRANLVTAVPGEAVWELFLHLVGVYYVTILIMVGPESSSSLPTSSSPGRCWSPKKSGPSPDARGTLAAVVGASFFEYVIGFLAEALPPADVYEETARCLLLVASLRSTCLGVSELLDVAHDPCLDRCVLTQRQGDGTKLILRGRYHDIREFLEMVVVRRFKRRQKRACLASMTRPRRVEHSLPSEATWGSARRVFPLISSVPQPPPSLGPREEVKCCR